MQALRRLPGTVANAAHELAVRARRLQGQAAAVTGDGVALRDEALHADLQALDRGIDEARGAAGAGLFAQDVPGLDGLPQFDVDAFIANRAIDRKAEFEVAREPIGFERI